MFKILNPAMAKILAHLFYSNALDDLPGLGSHKIEDCCKDSPKPSLSMKKPGASWIQCIM